MIKKYIFLILLAVFFLMGCMNEEAKSQQEKVQLQQGYISKAKEMSNKLGLDDANISIDEIPSSIYLNVQSKKFEDLSDEQKYLYLSELYKIIDETNINSAPVVNSVYQLNFHYERSFTNNNKTIFPYGVPAGLPTEFPTPEISKIETSKGDFEMSWNTYNGQYNSLGGILTIRRQGSKFTEKLVMSDGSSGTYDLTVISEGNEIKLSGHLGDPYSVYPHDYIQIESNGQLGFYDDQGYIYSVPPLK